MGPPDEQIGAPAPALQPPPGDGPAPARNEVVRPPADGAPDAAGLSARARAQEARGDFEGMAAALQRDADAAGDPRTAARLYLRAGAVHEERLLRRDRAALLYDRAARLDPKLADARAGALRCYTGLRRWSRAKRTLDLTQAAGLAPATVATDYARLGALLVDEPLDHDLATEALKAALALAPATPGCREALAEIEAVAATWRARADVALESAAKARERRTAALLHLRAAALHGAYDTSPTATERIVDLVERALLLAPAMLQGVDLLERLLGEQEDWDGLARALQRLAGAVRDRTTAVDLELRLARLDLVRFGDGALALDAAQRAFELDPASAAAAQQAFELRVDAGRPAEALELLERHLAALPARADHERLHLLSARVALDLGDEVRARAHLDAAWSADPTSPAVAAALAPLLERAGDWAGLAGALEVRAGAIGEPVTLAQLLEQLARVELEHLDRPRDAMGHLARALALAPGRGSPRRAMEVVAARADLFPELARAYAEAAASDVADPAIRKLLLRRSAEVWDRDLQLPEQAVEAWRAVVALDVNDAGARAALEACRVRAGQLVDVERELRARLDGASPRERAAVLTRLAAYHEQAGDVSGAAAAWREAAGLGDEGIEALRASGQPRALLEAAVAALRARPDDAEALAECVRLARDAGEVPDLYAALDALARDLAPERAAAARALRLCASRLAEEELGDREDALAQLRSCLDGDGADLEALAALTRVLLEAERWSEARDALLRRAALATGPERAALLAQAGDLARERLDDPAGAAAAYRDAVAAAPAERASRLRWRLAAAAEAAGDHAEEARVLEELAADPAETAQATRRRARVLADHLGQPLAALVHFREALLASPGDEEARRALEALAGSSEPGVAGASAEALAAIADANGTARDRIAAQERLAACAASPAARAAAERRAARAWGEELGQWSMAFAALQRAVRAAPDDAETRRELRAAAARAELDDEAARLYREILPSLAPDAAPDAWAELATLEEERRHDADAAAHAWQEALRASPGRRDALAALVRLHAAAGRHREHASALLELAEHVPEPERPDLWRAAAVVLDERLGDPEQAASAWSRFAAARPDEGPFTDLERLLASLGRDAELAEVLERRRGRAGARDDVELSLRLAALRAATPGAEDAALDLLRQASHASPDHPGVRAALVELAASPTRAGGEALTLVDAALRSAGDHAGRVALRERRLARIEDLQERAELEREIRRVLEVDVGRPELALAAAARAVAAGGPAGADADAELERLAAAAGSFEPAAAACDAAAAASNGGDAATLRRRAARLRSRGGDAGCAVTAWQRVLEDAPGDPEAFAALQELHAASGDLRALAEVLRARAATQQGTARADTLVEAARALAKLGDSAEATRAAEEAHAADPAHAAALELLGAACERDGDLQGLARVLRARADAARDDAPRRRDLLVERARLLERSGDGAGAVESYAELIAEDGDDARPVEGLERLLATDAARPAAARALEEVHRARGDARKLATLMEVRLGSADASERAPLLRELAALRERLGEPLGAFEAVALAWREAAPGDERALRSELERLAVAAAVPDRLAAEYEGALGRDLPAAVLRELQWRLADLFGGGLARPDLAARALEAIAGEDCDPQVLAALAALYRGAGAWQELADVLRRQAEAAPPGDARKQLILERAALLEGHLSDREGAMEAYRQILSVDPEDPNALHLLGNLLGAAERWDELAAVLNREVEVADARPNLATEAVELRFRLGRIRQQRLSDTAGALQCYRGVLERVPRHPAALAALEDLARSGGSGAVEAATLLEPIYEQEGEHEKLLATLEARATAATEPAARAALLRRIAEVHASGKRDPVAAFQAAARAVREDPDDASSIALATDLAGRAELEASLAALLAEVVDRPSDPQARLELRRSVARLADRAGDAARAAETWTRVLDLAPDDPEALASVTAAHRASGDLAALAQVLRRRTAVEEEPAARVALLAELADVQERQQDVPGAIATLRRLLEIEPRRDALARLDALCVQAGRWVELADVLRREATCADADGDAAGALSFRQRLAELKEGKLLDREGALALYEHILQAHPSDPQALSRVEALLQRDPTHARAAALLERAYAATGAWPRYAAVLEVRAGERPDPIERKALFLELAEVREKRLDSPELAFVATCRAFREDPSDAAVREQLARLATATGHLEELAAIYEDELPRLAPAAAAEVSLTLASLQEQLGVPDAAVAWLERTRQLDPGVAPRALAELDRLHRTARRNPELADVLEAEAALAVGEQRPALLLRLGQLCEEELQDAARAVRAYEALVAEHPRHAAGLRALERLYEGAGRVAELAENLAVQRELAGDAAARLRITARLASTRQALGDEEDAIALWRDAVAADPRHEPALAALEGLYEKLERWPELVELLRGRLTVTADRREAARLNEKLGAVLSTKLADPVQAIQAYQAVLESEPRHRKALEALRDLQEGRGDVEALASVYRRLIPLQEDAAGVKAVRLRLAEVLAQAGKPGEAAEQGRRALDLAPHDEKDLARMAAVFDAANTPQDRVKAVEARAALLADAGRVADAVEAWLEAATTWERLRKPDAACAALEKVLERAPARRDAWTRLKELYAHAADWRSYVRVCDLFAAHLEPAERLATLKELAEIHEKRLGQKEMAFITLCRALADDPADASLVAAARRLADETQGWDELCAVLEQVADDSGGAVRARLLLDLGRLRDARLDDAEGAEAAFRKALEADPASPEALDALTDLFTRRGRVRDLVIALEQKLEAAASMEEQKATLSEMARIYDGQLHDPGEAIAALKRLLELDGGDRAALEALGGLYRRQARWSDLAGILARARDLATDDAGRIGYQLQLAAVQENELADDEAAVDAYRGALALDEAQPEALAGLERVYTKLDRFAELNAVYAKQAEIAADPRERVRILAKSAAILEEKLADPRRAIERYEAVLTLDGGHLPAVKSLAALYRREGLHEKLIAVLQHQATLTRDPRELVSLEVQIGEVWWSALDRVDRAEAMFAQALQHDPESREALSALGRLHERAGAWGLALEMIDREARLVGGGPESVALQWRMARLHEEQLHDVSSAKLAYARALDVDPGHLPSLRALRAIAEAEGDRTVYLRLLQAEARYAETDAEKARLLQEAGRIHQEERDDLEGAVRLYEESLRHVPDHLAAARPLADLYVSRSDWPRAEAVLDVVVKRLAQDGDTADLCRQSYRLGHVAEKLGKPDKALACYRRSYELDPTYLPALEGLGALLVENEQWQEALKVFQAILIHHRDDLTDLEVVETYRQVGDVQLRLGHGDRAARSYEKALEIDPEHERTRRSLVAVLDAAGDWEAAVEQRRKLLPIVDGAARRDLYVEIGTLCRDRLRDPFQAVDAFSAAARLDPGHPAITEALLGLYRDTHQGQKAADVLGRLIESGEAKADAGRAAHLRHALAVTLRDEIKDEAAAIAELERALDADPTRVEAFADLEALLTRRERWRDLEQAYLRLIQRLSSGPEHAGARLALWKALGELYRRVLHEDEQARTAFEVVVKGDPEDAGALAAHAELSARSPGHAADAVASYRRLLSLGGEPRPAVSALVQLHAGAKSYDDAYCAAQALAFLLGGATDEETQVITKLRRFARETASGALDGELWDKVLHPRARGPLAAIMALLVRDASDVFVQTPKDLGLHPKKDELDVAGSMLFFANMYKYVARVLGFPAPRLFRSHDGGARLAVLPLAPAALAAGEELFKERPRRELCFTIGKAMTFLRPDLQLARLMPHDQLEAVFQAAASLGTSRFVVTADPHLVEKLKRRLENALPVATRTQTLKLLARAYCDVQRPGDVRAYMDAAELTSNRVAALLAGDLEVTRRMVLTEKAAVAKLKEEVRLRDLIVFCTSAEYAELRARLGLSVAVPET